MWDIVGQDACFYQTTPQPPTQGKSEGMQSKPHARLFKKPSAPLKAHCVCLCPLCPHEGDFSAVAYEYDDGTYLFAELSMLAS